jgi:pSer/pThr/pTyr-binding forkhead associated (FHA) protein
MTSNQPARTDRPLASLIAHHGPEEGRQRPIYSPVVRIGQGPQNDLVLDDDTVSTNHARLEFEDGGWRIYDLGSRNGTYVEGVKLAPEVPTPLPRDALVAFGAMKLTFHVEPDVDPEKARAEYTPPPPRARLAERSGSRLPVWVVVLFIVVLALLIGLFVMFGGAPEVMEQVGQPVSHLLRGDVVGEQTSGLLVTALDRIAA